MGRMEKKDIRTQVPTIYGDWVDKWGDVWKNQITILKEKFGSSISKAVMPGTYPTDVPIIYVKAEKIVEVLEFFKNDSRFKYDFLADLTATDESPEQKRFEIVYNLFSHEKRWRIRVKVKVKEGEEVPSIHKVWPGANWSEREVWDMFGVRFTGHPNMRRILLDNRWEGHPLRKDYPLQGYQIFSDPEQIDEKLLED